MLISKVKTREAAQSLLADDLKFAEFVKKNNRFLISIIGKIKSLEDYDYNDLLQESKIALWSALQSYDPEQRILDGEKSASFSTYSYWLIRNEIYHYVNGVNKVGKYEKPIEAFLKQQPSNKGNATDGGNGGDTYNEKHFVNVKDYAFEEDVIQKVDDESIMSKLTSTEQIIFQKKIIEDMTHDEVAAELKMPAATYMTIYYKSFVPKLQQMGYSVTNTINKRPKSKKK